MSGERMWVYNPTRKKGVSPKLTSQWVGPSEVLEQLSVVVYRVKMCARGRVVLLHRDHFGTLPPPGGQTSRHTQLTQHGSTHTDESSDSNRQWGVWACDPTGSQEAAASPSLSGLCCRLRTGKILVRGNVAPGLCLLCCCTTAIG